MFFKEFSHHLDEMIKFTHFWGGGWRGYRLNKSHLISIWEQPTINLNNKGWKLRQNGFCLFGFNMMRKMTKKTRLLRPSPKSNFPEWITPNDKKVPWRMTKFFLKTFFFLLYFPSRLFTLEINILCIVGLWPLNQGLFFRYLFT